MLVVVVVGNGNGNSFGIQIFFNNKQRKATARSGLKDNTIFCSCFYSIDNFLSGIFAKLLTAHLRFENKEEAFVCAMFHNLGKLLVIFYLPEERQKIEDLIQRLELNYDRLSGDLKTRFIGGLSIGELFSRTIGPIFGSTKTIAAWIEELKADFTSRLGPRIEEIAKEGAEHYLDGVRLLLNDLIADLSRARPASSATAPQLYMKLPGWHGETSDSVVKKLRDLLTDDRFATALQGSGATAIPVAIGGGLATLIAVVTGAVAHVLVVDLTGGILTALTAAGAGLFVMFKRRGLIRDFETALDNGRSQFVREVRDKLTAKLSLIYEEIRRVCHPFFDEVESARKKLLPLTEERTRLADELQTQKAAW